MNDIGLATRVISQKVIRATSFRRKYPLGQNMDWYAGEEFNPIGRKDSCVQSITIPIVK